MKFIFLFIIFFSSKGYSKFFDYKNYYKSQIFKTSRLDNTILPKEYKYLKMDQQVQDELIIGDDKRQSSDPIGEVQKACDRLGQRHVVCGQYNYVKNNIEKMGQEIVKNIPYPTAAALSTFMIKTLSEQKVSLDINDKNFFSPKIELYPDKANLKFSYSW